MRSTVLGPVSAGPRRVAWLAAVVALVAVAAGCGGDDGAGGAADGGGGAETDDGAAGYLSDEQRAEIVEQADRDGELRFAFSTGASSFDPHRATSPTTTDNIYQRQVYDGLLTLGRSAEGEVVLVPQLATSYESADDGTSVEFKLRTDVTFQDGTPFDAGVVKANIERAVDHSATVAGLVASIASAEVVDESTVVLHLAHPDSSLLWTLASTTAGLMASPAAFEADLAKAPVGTGPFQLVSFLPDAEVVYERWGDHWDPDAALLRRLTISALPDVSVRYNGLRSREFDASYLQAPLDFESRSLEGEGYHRTIVYSPISNGLLLNAKLPPFDDVRVRQAVSMAINRPEIVESVLNGLNPPVHQTFNEGYLGHDSALNADPYDVDAARDLIDEAGATGAAIEIIHSNSPPNDTLAPIIQAALEEIGLDVELRPVGSAETRPSWRRGESHGAVLPIIAYVDPGQTLAASYLGVDNPAPPPPDLVDMAARASTLPAGSPEQEQAYKEISAYLVENPVHVPIAQFTTVVASQPRVLGSASLMTTGIADLDFRYVGIDAS